MMNTYRPHENTFTDAFRAAVAIIAEERNSKYTQKNVPAPETLNQRIRQLEQKKASGTKLKKWQKGLAAVAVILACLIMIHTFLYYNVAAYQNMIQKLYQPKEVREALDQLEQLGITSEISDDVLLPASMDIQIPNIDPAKIYNNDLLTEYDHVFIAALIEHGYSEEDAKNMTMSQYKAIEDTWLLPDDMIKRVKNYSPEPDPELEGVDVSTWTYGDFEAYAKKIDAKVFAGQFTAKQLAELEARDIRIEDAIYLLREFYTPEALLAQSDEILKATLEAYYQFKIYMELTESE